MTVVAQNRLTIATMGTSLVAIALMCASVLVGAVTTHRIVAANEHVALEALAARDMADTVLSTLQSAGSGQRDYLLTGNVAYLAAYNAARTRLETALHALRAVPMMSRESLDRIGTIQELSGEWLAQLAEGVALEQSGDHSGAVALIRSGPGRPTMDEIGAQISALQADLARTAGHDGPGARSWPWMWSASLAGLALALFVLATVMQVRAHRAENASLRRLERFTRAFGLAHGMIRGLDGEIRFWSHGAERLYGYTAHEALGRVSHTLLRTEFSQPRDEIEATVLRAGQWQGMLVHRARDGTALHIASHWALHRGEAGEPDSIIEVNNDVTNQRRAEFERSQTDALLHTIVSTAPGLIYAKDRQGRMTIANQAVMELVGKPWSEIEGRTDMEFLDDPEQAGRVMANDARLMQEGQLEEFEELVGTAGDQPRVWFSIKAPLRDDTGAVTGLVGMSVEITERKRVEERLRLMVNELNHRVKNTLAVVQAIASQTLHGSDPAVGRALEGRLLALASVHDVLTREAWHGADCREVVATAVAPDRGEAARIHISGPDLRLCSRAAIALSLGLHELAANARIHGALSGELGEVDIRWTIARDLLVPALRLSWAERGGPAASPPARRGFGMRLIERSLAQDLGGTVRLNFADPRGLSCQIEAPLAEVAAPAEVLPFPAVGHA